jgi:fumarylacetoacetate (FAA) hydrolase
MKLATLHDGSRDGLLAVVSRDLALVHPAQGIAGTLRQLLDDWNFLSPQLEDLYATLNDGKARHAFGFDPRQCMAPLPRTGLVAIADIAAAPTLRSGDGLQGPMADVRLLGDNEATACAPALALVCGDIGRGSAPGPALDGVRLMGLATLWSRGEAPALQPPLALGPVLATPDELGAAWREGRLVGVAPYLVLAGAADPVMQPPLAMAEGRADGCADGRADGPAEDPAQYLVHGSPSAAAGTVLSWLAAARRLGAGSLLVLPAAAPRVAMPGQTAEVGLRLPDGSEPLGRLRQQVLAQRNAPM